MNQHRQAFTAFRLGSNAELLFSWDALKGAPISKHQIEAVLKRQAHELGIDLPSLDVDHCLDALSMRTYTLCPDLLDALMMGRGAARIFILSKMKKEVGLEDIELTDMLSKDCSLVRLGLELKNRR